MTCFRRRLFHSLLLLSCLNNARIDSFNSSLTFGGKRFSRNYSAKPFQALEDDGALTDSSRDQTTVSLHSPSRRQVIQSAFSSMLVLSQFPQASFAGEVGARITKAVTTSDLGIAVRQSVVKGAQTMDKIDGQWEQFSDKFGLGEARKQQDGKPAPKAIPQLQPLDTELAKQLLATSDQTFLALTGVSPSTLARQVESVATTVRPSFERAGAVLEPGTAQAFNFDSYSHYKAYSDLLVKTKLPYNKFRKDFENQMGQELVAFLLPSYKSSDNNQSRNLQATLKQRLSLVDQVCKAFVEKGLVAATERSTLDDERISDWSQDLTDLEMSLALDGDATMNAQILLQEQGFRLYPNYTKYTIAKLLEMPTQTVTIDDYYLDPDYNTDPNLFEVKEVMLNIVLDSDT